MLAQLTQISPHTHISRTRLLPYSGKVLARLDQEINALDAVAETRREGSHVLVDVQRILDLKKNSDAGDVIVRKPGEHINKDDVLAEMRGMFQKVLRSPVSGQVTAIQGGRVFIKVKQSPQRLLSGFNGVVTGIIPDRGAVIENNGAVIQASWGNNQINQGALVCLAKSPAHRMGMLPVEKSLKGKVVAAGHCSHALFLHLAGRLGLNGLVLPSMSPSLIQAAKSLPFPVILTEGFGNIPYNPSAFDILSVNNGRLVCLFGANNTLGMGERPEVFIPLEKAIPAKTAGEGIQNDQRVRVRISPYTGRTGVVSRIYAEPVKLPSGIVAPAADIQLDTQERVMIPLVNLDVLE